MPPITTVTVLFGVAVPVSVGVLFAVILSVLLTPVSSVELAGNTLVGGASVVAFTVKVSPLALVLFPAASVDVITGV